MSISGVAAFALGTAVLALYLRPQAREIAALLGICATVLLFAAFASRTFETLTDVLDILAGGELNSTAQTLAKALGVALLAQFTADVCREAGEPSVGAQVEMAARLELLLLSLPLAKKLLEIAEILLS